VGVGRDRIEVDVEFLGDGFEDRSLFDDLGFERLDPIAGFGDRRRRVGTTGSTQPSDVTV